MAGLLALALMLSALISLAEQKSPNAEQRTARHFDSIRLQPGLLLAFLREMPKGGDLHIHLAGAIYAESLIDFAAQDGFCVDRTTSVLIAPPCDEACDRYASKPAIRCAYRTTFSTTPSSTPGPCATGPAKSPVMTTFLPPSTNSFRP